MLILITVVVSVSPPQIPDDIWRNYLLHFDSGEGCGFQGCEMEESEHYHCKDDGCETLFRSEDGVKEHGRNHFIQDQISETFFQKIDPEEEEAKSAEEKDCLLYTSPSPRD